VLGCQE